jgi:hypothetical protein
MNAGTGRDSRLRTRRDPHRRAATNSGFDPYSLIGTLLTPVIVVILLLTNKLHTEGDYKRLQADLDLEKGRTTALQEALVERVIPALTRSTLVLEQVSPLLQTEVHLRTRERDRRSEGT